MAATKILLAIAAFALLECCMGDRTKVYNGREVTPHVYPWTGWLLIGQKRVKCGLTLISEMYALTSASCASAEIVSANFGDHSRTDSEGSEQVVGITSVTPHPDYNATTFENDIAVVELASAVDTSNSGVSTISMLQDDHLTDRVLGKHCRGAGWGYQVSGSTDKVRDQSNVLLEVVIDRRSDEECQSLSAPSTAICYQPFRDPASVTCEGDVGGPYMCKKKGEWVLAGVLSGWNVDQGCTSGARAATVVSDYLDWIADQMA